MNKIRADSQQDADGKPNDTPAPVHNRESIIRPLSSAPFRLLNDRMSSSGKQPIKKKNCYHIDDFSPYNDEDFLVNAYRAVLRRMPDPAGHHFYLSALRNGELSKADILLDLVSSPEGRSKNVTVQGLQLPKAARASARIPLRGRILSIITGIIQLPKLVKDFQHLEAQLGATQTRIDHMARQLNDSIAAIDKLKDQKADKIDLETINQKVRDHLRSVLNQERRLQTLLQQAETAITEPSSEALTEEKIKTEKDRLLDGMYCSFEDRFRGGRPEIKERLKVYLPYIQKRCPKKTSESMVDLGCGRGEWLELLGEEGFTPLGVDSNRIMIEECREQGLEVVENDAIQYLKKVPSDQLTVVTAFHLIEHLPLEALIELLDEIIRTLKPGGMTILETPNPDNIFVSTKTFYYDPTHRNPLPYQSVEFLLEARGFADVEILPLNPSRDAARDRFEITNIAQWISEHFYGFQDYAVIGRK